MSNKKRIAAIALCAALATSSIPFAAACNNSSSVSAYFVNYDLNYDDVDARQITVQSGQKAREWRAYREGYSLLGWYTDEACTVPYDFSKGVSSNITLYAGWKPEKGFVEVNFNFSCPGKTNKTVSLKSGDTVMSKAIPDTSRIGYNFTGWYKDENCTEKWDLDNDLISDAMTLYAGYEIDQAWVERDENGNIIYENESVTVWCANTSIVEYKIFQEIVDEFNKEHEGKIKINPTDTFTGQATLLLRNQLMEYPEYKSFSKVINDALFYGLPKLLEGLEGKEEITLSEVEEPRRPVRQSSLIDEEFYGVIVRLLREIVLNVVINKSILSSLFNGKCMEYKGCRVTELFKQGLMSDTPDYLEQFELEQLKKMRR